MVTDKENRVSENLETHFASPKRATPGLLEKQITVACRHPLTSAIMQSFLGAVIILNRHRQAIAANDTFLSMSGVVDPKQALGLRPGEALTCVNVPKAPNGCGTGLTCRTCGAVLAIVRSQERDAAVDEECLMTREQDGHIEAVEFRLRANPIELDGDSFTIVTLTDIQAEKRVDVLNRVFLHDALNYLHGLSGLSDLLLTGRDVHFEEVVRRINQIASCLVDLTSQHRDLLLMENNAYETNPEKIDVTTLLGTVRDMVVYYDTARAKSLRVKSPKPQHSMVVDARLVTRVLVNMVKNAFEATRDNSEVYLGYTTEEGDHVFSVWNEGEIPEEIARRVFQRSFSTKSGQGRGLGTYSMKLIGERFLGGKVDFESSAEGTTFTLRLPQNRAEA